MCYYCPRVEHNLDILENYFNNPNQQRIEEYEMQFIQSLVELDIFIKKRNQMQFQFNIANYFYDMVTEKIEKAVKKMSPLLAQRYNTERQRVNTFKNRQISLYPNF